LLVGDLNSLDRSAIILAGGMSKEFNNDKASMELDGKPLISYVVEAVQDIAEQVIVVTDSQEVADAYAKVVPYAEFVVNTSESEGILAEVLTGFEAAQGEYSLVLPSGSPFVSPELISLLYDLCIGKAAVVPRWTNQECEPLHAVYNTKMALEVAKAVLAEGQTDMVSVVEKLRGVRYLSTMVIEQLDPDFRSFFTVTTPVALKKAITMAKPKPKGRVKTKVRKTK
jgi:molybdopterin-guanine dinucleotide biosynthesis protein A